MSNGRNKSNKPIKGDGSRDPGGFVALPWSVLDCAAYKRLSANARALLFEVARQYVRDNNGRLLLSRAYMEKRGWTSNDMLTKGKRELLEGGFIFETVIGQRPNKASWYAVTWHALDRHPGYDAGALGGFQRGAYRLGDQQALNPKPTRQELFEKWRSVGANGNAPLAPPHGTESPGIAPPHGTAATFTVPPHGAIKATFADSPVPPHGHLLEVPSAAVGCPVS